ncbi:MAG: hypothetical protein FWD42_07190, partial [Solirubrobacterales bacterium]|nr:hypothetical protein [Solirubrobacterales bacterium]
SVLITVTATITHPLVGYETETIHWWRYLREGFFQPTIATAYGLGRGWGGVWPFLVAVCGAVGCGAFATDRMCLDRRQLALGVAALGAWGLFAALAPTLLGLDHQGLLDTFRAGDAKALRELFGSYPLQGLVPVACGAGLVALLAARLLRHRPAAPRAPAPPGAPAATESARAAVPAT